MKSVRRKLLLRQPMYDFLKYAGKLPKFNTLMNDDVIEKAVKFVSKLRPTSNELIDQCPITDKDLVQRVKLICNYLHPTDDKKALFIGDDDLTSAVIGNTTLMSLSVVDIDKEILSTIKKSTRNHRVNLFSTNILNVVDGELKDPLDEKFDAFVTDPPYTEMGYKYFLSYGAKHINMGGFAFIATPYMSEEDWSIELLLKVEDFLIKNGFVIIEIIPGFAEYQHDDKVVSSMIVAKKVTISKQAKIELRKSKTYTTGFEL